MFPSAYYQISVPQADPDDGPLHFGHVSNMLPRPSTLDTEHMDLDDWFNRPMGMHSIDPAVWPSWPLSSTARDLALAELSAESKCTSYSADTLYTYMARSIFRNAAAVAEHTGESADNVRDRARRVILAKTW